MGQEAVLVLVGVGDGDQLMVLVLGDVVLQITVGHHKIQTAGQILAVLFRFDAGILLEYALGGVLGKLPPVLVVQLGETFVGFDVLAQIHAVGHIVAVCVIGGIRKGVGDLVQVNGEIRLIQFFQLVRTRFDGQRAFPGQVNGFRRLCRQDWHGQEHCKC